MGRGEGRNHSQEVLQSFLICHLLICSHREISTQISFLQDRDNFGVFFPLTATLFGKVHPCCLAFLNPPFFAFAEAGSLPEVSKR